MFEAIIFVSILFVFLATFIFWCCEKKRDLDTRIIGGAFIAYCFISVFAQIYLLPILEIIDWDKRISLQMQLTALVVGLTAAIIAFRNYQRKSGSELYYTFFDSNEREIEYVNGVVLYNNKDRTIVIFAIDIDIVVLDTKTRIRLFQSNTDPVIVAAYSSAIISLDEISKYTSDYFPSSFSEDNIQCICISMNGTIPAKKANVDLLKEEFIKTCIFPQTISNVPEAYDEKFVPMNATHWITLIESYVEFDQQGDPVSLDWSYRIHTGYYQDDIFYITPTPEKGSYLDKYLHESTRAQIREIKSQVYDSYIEGYFDRCDDIGLMDIHEIEFTQVTKK